MHASRVFLFASLALLTCSGAFVISDAAAETAVMVIAYDPALESHYPGPDGLIGTQDDVVSDQLSGTQQSAPNGNGSLSYNAFRFSPQGSDPAMPTGYDAITFVNGTFSIDKDVLAAGGGAVVTDLKLTYGTDPFPGHGLYTAEIVAVNGGSYDPVSHAYTLNVDFEYTIFGFTYTESGVEFTGTAYYQSSADFAVDSGSEYFENVVKPLAQANGATGATVLEGEGTLTSLGYPIKFAVVGLEGVGFVINAGLNDAWGIEGVPNQGLFLTIFEENQFAFFALFTYDSSAPGGGSATLGAADQRWLTAFGSYSLNQISASAEVATGGLFDSGSPTPTLDSNYGMFNLEFTDCNHGTLTYNLPGPGLSGEMKLYRFLNDNVPYCVSKGYPSP